MTVDRGGLNYKIQVRDNFSKTTKRFRSEILKSKKAFDDFQKTKVKDRQRRKPRGKSDERLARDEERKRSREEQTALAKRARNAKKSQQVRDQATARDVKRAKAAEIAVRKRAQAEARAKRELEKSARAAERLNKSLKRSSKSAGGLAFKFRRLVGTLAVFTLARRAVQGFNQMISSSLRFNDTIQASTLGIAGLINTLADVRDEQGNLVEGAEAFNVAVGISRKQVAALRQDSLKTVATFEQLLDTFQVAVGPGLAAGLGLDEIRTLAVQISQAATALSVPQNQLAEEIRSLLAGTIQARTTRIATALGITNKDIKEMKEAGTLFEELTSQLQGFSDAAQKAARETLGGIATLLKGAIQETLGSASENLFGTLLENLNILFDQVITIRDEFGNIKPNPRIVSAFKQVFDALSRGVDAAAEFGEELGFDGLDTTLAAVAAVIDLLVSLGETLGDAFVLFADSAEEAGKFISDIVKDLTGFETTFSNLVKIIDNQFVSAFQDALDIIRLIALELRALKEAPAKAGRGVLDALGDVGLAAASGFGVPGAQAALIKSQDRFSGLDADGKRLDLNETADQAALREARNTIFQRIADRQAKLEKDLVEIVNGPALTVEAELAGEREGPGGTSTSKSVGDAKIEERIIKLKQEQALLDARARASQTQADAENSLLNNAQTAVIAARTAHEIALAQLAVKREQARVELTEISSFAKSLGPGAQREQQEDLFQAVAKRRQAELEVLAAQVQQTAELKRQQTLIAEGDVFDGFKQGLIELSEEFGTRFQAGIEIARTAVDGLAQFASQAIVDAFDPTKEVDIVERFARLMQQIAQVIIQQLIQLAIARAVLGAPAGPVAQVPGLGIPISSFSFAKGGPVPHWGPRAQGLAAGGRPSRIPASDTVPAWLTPGEFVMRKAAVDSIGISALTAMNSGNFGVTGSSDAAGASTGMARGGSVAESARPSGTSAGAPTIVPVQVAGEKELDQLTNGGKRAMLEFLRENSDTIAGFQRG